MRPAAGPPEGRLGPRDPRSRRGSSRGRGLVALTALKAEQHTRFLRRSDLITQRLDQVPGALRKLAVGGELALRK